MAHQTKYALDAMETDRIVDFILSSYWGKQLLRSELIDAFARSHCVGLFDPNAQIGFARAVSDGYTCAYVSDFFIFEEYRRAGHGLSLWRALENHPNLSGVRRWYLGTKDAHGFYEKCGFKHSPDGIYMNFRRR